MKRILILLLLLSASTVFAGTGTLEISTITTTGSVLYIDLKATNDMRMGASSLNVEGYSGNVGIGTTNPGYKLEVEGSIHIGSGAMYFPDGTSMSSANAGSASSLSDTKDVVITADSDADNNGQIEGYIGGTQVFVVANDGNVGIGTTGPTAKLDVVGDIDAANLTLSNTLTAAAVDTGQGAYEVYAMNQDVETTDNVIFSQANVTNTLTAGTLTDGTLSITGGNLTSGNTLSSTQGTFDQVNVTSITAASIVYFDDPINMNNNDIQAYRILADTIQAASIDGLNISDDSNTLYLKIQDGGNVGIGEYDPSYKLDVAGSIRFSQGALYFADNSSMTTAGVGSVTSISNSTDVVITADSDTNGTGYIQFVTSTTEKMRIQNTGMVGIGTTNPAYKLDVNGDIRIATGGLFFPDGTSITTAGAGSAGALSNTKDVVLTADSDTNAQGEILFNIGVTEVMAILNNGNVGIGSINPGNTLDVNGTVQATDMTLTGALTAATVNTGQGANELYAMDQDVQTSDNVTFLGAAITNTLTAGTLTDGTLSITAGDITSADQVTGNTADFNQVQVDSISATSTIYLQDNLDMGTNILYAGTMQANTVKAKTSLGLYIEDDGGNGMFIEDGGNIGIGTTTPSYKLDVNGSIRIGTGGLYFPDETFLTTGSSGSVDILENDEDITLSADHDTNSTGEIQFKTNGTEKMVILNDGNVGIGVTNPSGLFQVGGGTLTVLSSGRVAINKATANSILEINGSLAGKVTSQTATYTAADELIINYSGTATVTLNLPQTSTVTGRMYLIRNNKTGGSLIIDPNASETIDGNATYVMPQDTGMVIVADGSNGWYSY
ncbi:beta strand repeat-containing protein [bacterium]